MSTPFEEQHALWTYDNRPEWLEHNTGCADRLLMLGLSLETATTGANHLADIYKGDTFEVRDIRNTTVHTANAARRPSSGRRPLGKRGA